MNLLFVLMFLWSQVPRSASFTDPARVRDALKLNGARQPEVVRSLNLPCFSYEESSLDFVKLRAAGQQAVVVARSSSCDVMSLLVFDRTASGWVLRDSLSLSTHYGMQPKISFPRLIAPNVQSIQVEGEPTDWGTGALQRDFALYGYCGDAAPLITVLDEPLEARLEEEQTGQSEKNRFRTTAAQPNSGSFMDILEEQSITVRGVTVKRVRRFHWRREICSFEKVLAPLQ